MQKYGRIIPSESQLCHNHVNHLAVTDVLYKKVRADEGENERDDDETSDNDSDKDSDEDGDDCHNKEIRYKKEKGIEK
jgi:hypothetical protein